jgi:hypothetical protein
LRFWESGAPTALRFFLELSQRWRAGLTGAAPLALGWVQSWQAAHQLERMSELLVIGQYEEKTSPLEGVSYREADWNGIEVGELATWR